MRRKSNRTASKTTEKPPETQRKSRRQSRRQRKSLSRSSSEESEEKPVEQKPTDDVEEVVVPVTEEPEQPIWKVTPSSTPSGEIQKLKFCLTRPLMSPEKEKPGRRRRDKSGGQTDEDSATSSEKVPRKTRHRGSSGDNFEDCDEEYDHQEDKKGKGKSKTKHKSKSEKTLQMQEVEDNSQSEISENVQVTPQSPQAPIDTRVDNESISTIESETITDETEHPEILHHNENSYNDCETETGCMEVDSQKLHEIECNTPPPILEKHDNLQKLTSNSEEFIKSFEAPHLSRADADEHPTMQSAVDVVEEVVAEVVELVAVEDATQQELPEEKSESNVAEDSEMDTLEPSTEESENVHIISTEVVGVELKTAERLDLKEETLFQTPESDHSSEATESVTHEQNITLPVDSDEVVNEGISKSMEVDENQSEDDSMSRDVTMDTASTSFKENTSFDVTQSFSPDIKQMEEVNEELQTIKDKVTNLLQTPTPATRKWGNSFVGLELMGDSLQKIDINTIKEFCPTLQFLDENEVKIDVRERKPHSQESREKRKVSIDYKSEDSDYKRLDTQISVNSSEIEETPEAVTDNSNIIAMNRKISIVDDTASKLKPPPSPAKNPISEILYITNLVRPFTLKQLKELLERTGKIKENGFWTDRIKSKCYAHYETTQESEATRNALHGVNWPIGNGKKLMIEYATEEDFEKARNPTPVAPPVTQPVPEVPKTVEKDVIHEEPKNNYKVEEESKANKERQRHRSEGHVREWDIGKENSQKSRYRNKEFDEREDRNDRHKRRRTPSPTEDFLSRKEKKKEEDIPQKLMDDLFRKTKTTPSIYWLPLTPEEIATKQQQRLLRMAEHKRRMEESSRSRGDYGRGAPYRRRYD
ncbi:hypothetical protein RN001_007578 [Aquatica leii]|uniref:RRM domain-containing protein n=1 Tax=Aquatica leii TaxID=1421715 RepID=A0AAN7P8I4_9COLE|nr:hypothetical protein RN001_007578 [Aquatica leii]